MEIPKYIDKALRKRTIYALLLEAQCAIVDDYIAKNDIDVPGEDCVGGVEIYVNPVDSERSVRESIMAHEVDKKS